MRENRIDSVSNIENNRRNEAGRRRVEEFFSGKIPEYRAGNVGRDTGFTLYGQGKNGICFGSGRNYLGAE